MSDYLKMADTFALIESDNFQSAMVALLIAKASMPHSEASAIAHAVSWHDELVADVERLRVLLGDCKDLIESSGFKHGFGNNDMNNVLNSIELELSKK